MWNATLDNTFVDRLKKILANRYGKSLQVRRLMDLTEVDAHKEFFTKGRDLHIPIRVKGAFLGTAVVAAADDLNEEHRQGIADLIKMTLEPAMYQWYLIQKENNLEEISKAHLDVSNVRLFGEDMPSIDDVLDDKITGLENKPGHELISHLVHLEGSQQTMNKKVALQLHDMTSRWAFVPFNDIKGQLHSTQDFSKMGAMTVFVENIEDLNASEQELLLEYVSEDHGGDEPLIITSSRVSVDELGKKEGMNSRFVDEIGVNSFEVDKAPLTTQALKDVLELFFLKGQAFDS